MKFYITSELALLIKNPADAEQIPSKELADRIGKSNSYIPSWKARCEKYQRGRPDQDSDHYHRRRRFL